MDGDPSRTKEKLQSTTAHVQALSFCCLTVGSCGLPIFRKVGVKYDFYLSI